MGGRYYITGVQLGIIKGLLATIDIGIEVESKTEQIETINNLLDGIEDDQYLGEREDFEQLLEKIKKVKGENNNAI